MEEDNLTVSGLILKNKKLEDENLQLKAKVEELRYIVQMMLDNMYN